MNNRDFPFYVTKFFSDYLPHHKNFSKNTISLYRYCFVLFLKFCDEYKNINIDKLTFSEISRNLIFEYLSWLEDTRNCSVATRNQRLVALKSFFKFVQFEAPEFYQICSDIRAIELKKAPKKTFDYLSVEAIKILLKQPDPTETFGMRDLTLLTLMYHSACRVQELIDLHVHNIKFDPTPTLCVTGKGNKTRIVPLNTETIKLLKKYILAYNLQKDDILFTNKFNKKFSERGIEYIVDKYVEKAKLSNPEKFCCNIFPHSFRHSKAMHLLEEGVNLIYIKDFLGHVSVSTTEIYAKANPEIRRKEIEKASKSVITKSRFTKNEKSDLIKFLKYSL